MNLRSLIGTPFLFCSLLLGVYPLWAQSAVLKGTISDAAYNTPVPGVDVTVQAGTKKLGTATSLASGQYTVTGLKRGDHVEVYYSRLGYKPNPLGKALVLSKLENVQDIPLVRDVGDAGYWRAYWISFESHIDKKLDSSHQLQLYKKALSYLHKIGLSPQPQSQASQQLVVVAPDIALAVSGQRGVPM